MGIEVLEGRVLTPEDLDRAISFFTGPRTVREILWQALIAHGIHHRGQLTLMCRLAGGVPPGLYGPNREQTAAMRAGAGAPVWFDLDHSELLDAARDIGDPALGGAIFLLGGHEAVAYTAAGLGAVNLVLASLWLRESLPHDVLRGRGRAAGEAWLDPRGIGRVWRNAPVRGLILLFFLVTFCFSMMETTILLKPHSEWRRVPRFYSEWPELLQAPLRHIWNDRITKEQLVKSAKVLMNIPQPYYNHYGGRIDFGPDGKLYIGKGDGGWEGDPLNAGQRLDVLWGKLLRIDVDTPDDVPYAIPKDNPFAVAPPFFPAYPVLKPWHGGM